MRDAERRAIHEIHQSHADPTGGKLHPDTQRRRRGLPAQRRLRKQIEIILLRQLPRMHVKPAPHRVESHPDLRIAEVFNPTGSETCPIGHHEPVGHGERVLARFEDQLLPGTAARRRDRSHHNAGTGQLNAHRRRQGQRPAIRQLNPHIQRKFKQQLARAGQQRRSTGLGMKVKLITALANDAR